MSYKVNEVARWAGVSVRTLHHYDEIGLLTPDATTEAGHRRYSERNLERLQQILFFRELGFALGDIKSIIDHPRFDQRQALLAHRELLVEKKRRLEQIIATIDLTIQHNEGGSDMTQEERFGGFDRKALEEHKEKYAAEAREKYGEAVVEATERRVAAYTEADWRRIHTENEQINAGIIAAMAGGPADPQVQAGVAALRRHITTYYYDCTPEIFRGLADLYTGDPRFTANIDKAKPGYATFLREAMIVYCDRLNG